MSDTDYVVDPPATGVWYDVEQTVVDALAVLRLTEQDVDVPRLEALVPAAAIDLEQYIDPTEVLEGPPPKANIQRTLVRRVVELYHDKGDTSTFVPPSTWRTDVLREKQRWGVS